MIGIKKTILFGVYILLTGGILLYVLFPSDAVREYLNSRINRSVSKAQVAIGSLSLRFPPSLALGDIVISKDGAPLLSVDRMKVTPKWTTLLSSRRALLFSGQTCNGEISGTLGAESNAGALSAAASGSFRDIQLGQVPVLQNKSPLGLSGVLSGSFELDASSRQPAAGSGSIVISNCSLALTEAFSLIERLLNIDRINFDRITADLYMEGGSLEIQNGEFDGAQMKGRLSGSIFFATRLPESDLDLEIAVTDLLSSTFSEINELTFRVSGTFESPTLSPVPTR